MPVKYICLLFIAAFLSFKVTAQSDKFQKSYDEVRSYLPHNTAEAEKKAQALLKITSKENDYEYAKTCLLMGLIKYHNANFYFSNQYFNKALATKYAKSDKKFAEDCHNVMGCNFNMLNHISQAIEHFNASLKLAETRGDSVSILRTSGNIALLEIKEGDLISAEQRTLKALAHFTRHKDTLSISHYHQNLAIIYREQKKFNKAMAHATQALQYLRGKDNYNTVKILYNIAHIHYLGNDIPASDKALSEALAISHNAPVEFTAITALVYIQLAKNNIARNSFGRVEEYLAKAKELSIKSGITENIDEYYYTRSDYYSKKGDYESFRKSQDEFAEYLKRKEEKKSLERYNELRALYGYERREDKIKAQQRELSVKRTQIWGLAAMLSVVLLASLIIAYYYLRMRAYIKRLYESNAEKTDMAPFAVMKDETGNKIVSVYNSIVELMENVKLYLQPGLSISDLSERLGTNDKYISQAINIYSENNFNVFINKYRVKYAQKILIANGSRIPLKAVSIDAGFCSHTTFYRQFKEYTGLTPSQFMEISQENLRKRTANIA